MLTGPINHNLESLEPRAPAYLFSLEYFLLCPVDHSVSGLFDTWGHEPAASLWLPGALRSRLRFCIAA
jgi:hypothetical protein